MEPLFEEKQGFSPWMKAVSLVPVVIFGFAAAAAGPEASKPELPVLVFGGLAVLMLLLALPNFLLELVTSLTSTHLHLRLEPLRLPVPFLPTRARDIPLSEIAHWEVHTYRPLSDRAYWGRNFWGLGTGSRGDRDIYVMKARPFSGRGVELRLRSGKHLLVGSQKPEELERSLARAKLGRS